MLACRFEAFDKTSTQPAQELRSNRDREKFVKMVNSAESKSTQPQKAQLCDSDVLRELQRGLRECCSQMTECRRELEALKASTLPPHTGVAGASSGTGFCTNRGSEMGHAGDNPPASTPVGTSSAPRSGPRRKSDTACHRCGQEGHWARSCPQARTRQHVHSQVGSEQNSPGAARVQTLADSKSGAAVYMPIRLFGHRVLALLDSGCDTSVIGRRHLPSEMEIPLTRRTLFVANGLQIPLIGEVTIAFQVQGLQHTADVVVTDAIDELILGIDWLAKEACRWDFGSKCIGIGNRWVELRSQPEERMRTAHAFVRGNLRCGFDRAKRRYDSRIKSMQYNVGDFVWYYMPKYGAGLNRKWMLASQGPYCVIRSINDVNKVIRRTPTSKPIIVHIDRLIHYHGEIPACWLNANAAAQCENTAADQSEPGECNTRTQACNQENKTNPISEQPESGQVTSSR